MRESGRIPTPALPVHLATIPAGLSPAKIQVETPKIVLDRAKIEVDTAKIDLEQSKIDSDTTKIHRDSSQICTERPKIGIEKPRFHPELEQILSDQPKIDFGIPKICLCPAAKDVWVRVRAIGPYHNEEPLGRSGDDRGQLRLVRRNSARITVVWAPLGF
jgi:hypothetical protein